MDREKNMTDALFLISSALNITAAQSIYDEDARFQQTLDTIDSIDKYCPNNTKIIFDSSLKDLKPEHVQKLNEKGASIVYVGKSPDVIFVSENGLKSATECIALYLTLNLLRENNVQCKRIYKISGRYRLTENFRPGYEHVNKYVFTKPTKTWMSEERIQQTGIDHVYQTRLFHFDRSLLDQFFSETVNLIKNCVELGVDIEHACYKNFKKYDPVELDIIGVCGNLAPNGEYINE